MNVSKLLHLISPVCYNGAIFNFGFLGAFIPVFEVMPFVVLSFGSSKFTKQN